MDPGLGGAPREHDPARHIYHGLHRPPWKRAALTLFGLLLIVIGTFLWLLPAIPGGFLAYLGIPFLFAISPRHEVLVRRWIVFRLQRARVRWKRWRAARRAADDAREDDAA